jgi:hypothetical protein
MPNAVVAISKRLRVKQVYDAYLDSVYEIDYYKKMYNDTIRYSRHFDFVIALSAALGGGSGLGILASSWMALPCSIITATALIISVAKQTYDWPAKAGFAVDMIERNGRLAGKLNNLVQDIQASRGWSSEFEKSYDELRLDINYLPQDKYSELSLSVREKIQEEIIRRENPAAWWKPNDD